LYKLLIGGQGPEKVRPKPKELMFALPLVKSGVLPEFML